MINQSKFELDARSNGFLLSYIGLLSILVQGTAVASLERRFGENKLVQMACFGLGVSLCACAMSFNLTLLALSLIPMVICNAILSTCILSSLTKVLTHLQIYEFNY